jgi:hypothetical protein
MTTPTPEYPYDEQGSDGMPIDSDAGAEPTLSASTHKPTKAARDTKIFEKEHIRLGGGADVRTQQGCVLFFQCCTTRLGG